MKQEYLACSVMAQLLLVRKSCGRKRKKWFLLPASACSRVKGWCSRSWGWLQLGVGCFEKMGRLSCLGASLPPTLSFPGTDEGFCEWAAEEFSWNSHRGTRCDKLVHKHTVSHGVCHSFPVGWWSAPWSTHILIIDMGRGDTQKWPLILKVSHASWTL